jgi:engulfment/cell motility protein 1
MIDGNRGEDVTPLIVQFQSNIIAFNNRQRKISVDPFNAKHRALLDDIMRAADIESTEAPFEALGFSSSRPELDFEKVGLLGLKAMWRFSKSPEFPKVRPVLLYFFQNSSLTSK